MERLLFARHHSSLTAGLPPAKYEPLPPEVDLVAEPSLRLLELILAVAG